MQADLQKNKKWLNPTFLSGLKAGVASGKCIQINNLYKLSPYLKKTRILSEKKAAASKKKAAPKKKAVTKNNNTAAKKPAPENKKTAVEKDAPKKYCGQK